MPIIDYPDWLPLAQKASKNMTLDTGFQADQPAVGPAIFENQTDDLKVTWSLTWIFTLAEERAFQQWLRSPNYLNRGLNWFRMNINLGGSGLQLQELHFTQMPVQTSIDGGVVTWTGTVIANHLYNADDEFDDIIVELPPPWDSWLDNPTLRYPATARSDTKYGFTAAIPDIQLNIWNGDTVQLPSRYLIATVEELNSQLWTVNSIKPNTDNTVSLTVAEYSDAIYE